jgi:ribosomal-protein-alanine N-acetyltransferase
MPWTIQRATTERDLDAVLEIENVAFTNPWTREMYRRELDHSRASFIYLLRVTGPSASEVAGGGGVVAGFCSFWLIFDELHINNLAVRPEFRRQGMASALLEHAIKTAAAQGGRRATLEVRRSNGPALRIYGRLGFEVAGVRRNYYENPAEDALILWRRDLAGDESSDPA